MDIMDNDFPVSISTYIKVKHPYANNKVIDFLVEWRNSVIEDTPFPGWATTGKGNFRKILIRIAQEYTSYLLDWAEDNEIKIHYKCTPNHVTDENLYSECRKSK